MKQWILGSLPSIIGGLAAIIAAALSGRNVVKVQELHIAINSRLDLLLATTASAAHAEGHAEGMKERGR